MPSYCMRGQWCFYRASLPHTGLLTLMRIASFVWCSTWTSQVIFLLCPMWYSHPASCLRVDKDWCAFWAEGLLARCVVILQISREKNLHTILRWAWAHPVTARSHIYLTLSASETVHMASKTLMDTLEVRIQPLGLYGLVHRKTWRIWRWQRLRQKCWHWCLGVNSQLKDLHLQLICVSDLENDYINPHDASVTLNTWAVSLKITVPLYITACTHSRVGTIHVCGPYQFMPNKL